jgi:hypothetical protein
MIKSQLVKRYMPWLLALATLAMAQQATEKKDAPPPSSEKQESTPLFKKQLGYKSSKTTKESTTLGFNGIDPSGKVDQKMLSENRPTAAELKSFLQEGGLNSK